jgi:hypothetical protein
MAVYVAKKIILKYCSKEFWQRGRLGVVVYGLCVQRVQVESRDCVQHRLVSCDVY